MSAPVAVVTVVHGRHGHLRGQLEGLRRQTRVPDLLVVVAMDDPGIRAVVEEGPPPAREVRHATIGRTGGRLPLAAARNLGVATAVAAGAGHLVLLDVDCVPDPALVERYAALLTTESDPDGPVVLCGGVAYEGDPDDGPRPPRHHPARPRLPRDAVRRVDDVTLFWSLSFAVSARDVARVGGFDERYVGYGAEDTDFGQRLARAGGRLLFVGGAEAVHQYHPSPAPPVQHVDDIVANATTFAATWGWWPMEGWLEQFRELGLVRRSPDGAWHTVP